jgi:hypothetical protein
MIDPKGTLLSGAEILKPVLNPYGFQFQFRAQGIGVGGPFAWGEFIRDERHAESNCISVTAWGSSDITWEIRPSRMTRT